jgi:hypothetical protein
MMQIRVNEDGVEPCGRDRGDRTRLEQVEEPCDRREFQGKSLNNVST